MIHQDQLNESFKIQEALAKNRMPYWEKVALLICVSAFIFWILALSLFFLFYWIGLRSGVSAPLHIAIPAIFFWLTASFFFWRFQMRQQREAYLKKLSNQLLQRSAEKPMSREHFGGGGGVSFYKKGSAAMERIQNKIDKKQAANAKTEKSKKNAASRTTRKR